MSALFDRTFVINLDRQPERWHAFQSRFEATPLGPVERASAVDGQGVDHTFLSAHDMALWPFWVTPYNNRLMTAGEVGCLLSHHRVWQEVARGAHPALILEDDAHPSPDFRERLSTLERELDTQPWDLLYLGHKQLEELETGTKSFFEPGYTYWTVGYILTPAGAKKLLATTILENMVPVDEFLPVMFGHHPHETLCEVFAACEKLSALAAQPPLIAPAAGQGASQTEESPELLDGLHIVTVATDTEKANDLINSLDRFGHEYTVLGAGDAWRAGDMSGPGGGQKVNFLREHLEGVDDNRIVLFVDGYDVVVNADVRTLLLRYARFGFDVVFAAEKTCWPDASLAGEYPAVSSDYRFLNSGAFIGRAGVLKRMLRPIPDDSDDQLFFTKVFLEGKERIALDARCTLFQTVSFAEDDIHLVGRQFRNVLLESNPVVLHGNGGAEAKRFYDGLVQEMSPRWEKLSTADLLTYDFAVHRKNEWATPATDILQLTFWTPEFCRTLIEAAELLNEWKPLENDTHPAQELRLKRISPKLVEHIEQHFTWRVVPWLRQVWHPFTFKGLKDLFVIKYSKYSQSSLALHNDISLVSASIKLNDNYAGGVLEFPRQRFDNAEVPVGSMIVWPSSVTHPHQSTEISEGTKYSLTVWTKSHG